MFLGKHAITLAAISFIFVLTTNISWSASKGNEQAPAPTKVPILLEEHFLEGKGLTAVKPEAIVGASSITGEAPIQSRRHAFYRGKIAALVFETEPGRVHIDGLPYDEYVHILEGRLILTPDGGEAMEFKTGDSLIVPEGYVGYWYMPEKYREFVIINTVSQKQE